MGSALEPAILSCDLGQLMLYFYSCQKLLEGYHCALLANNCFFFQIQAF